MQSARTVATQLVKQKAMQDSIKKGVITINKSSPLDVTLKIMKFLTPEQVEYNIRKHWRTCYKIICVFWLV